jgi:protein CpxP
MSFLNHPLSRSVRCIAIATLMGGAILTNPLAAMAQSAPAVADAPATKAETVDQRIADLHTALQITTAEEGSWNAVATTMRENAATMDKLIAEKSANAQKGMTAMDDLATYAKFAQAHVDGLKSLTSSFGTLYNAMPASQQKVADQVFQGFGHKGTATQK